MRGVLARREADVGRSTRQPLARGRLEVGEDRNPPNVFSGHHDCNMIARTTRGYFVPGALGYSRVEADAPASNGL
jgi:hypothetical protein